MSIAPLIDRYGTKHWFVNGLRHRDNGPAMQYANGNKFWYQQGLLHRDGGPAIQYICGSAFWYKNGLHHRLDGPAIELVDRCNRWFVNGTECTEEQVKVLAFVNGVSYVSESVV